MVNLMNYMQVLTDIGGDCEGLGFVVKIIKNGVFPIVQIGIPIILIVFGTLDLGKAVISSDDKAVKEAQSKLIKRCIYAVAVFFIVTIIQVIFALIGNVSSAEVKTNMDRWLNCWNSV